MVLIPVHVVLLLVIILDENALDHLAVADLDIVGAAVDQLVDEVCVQVFLFLSHHLHRRGEELKKVLCVGQVLGCTQVTGD